MLVCLTQLMIVILATSHLLLYSRTIRTVQNQHIMMYHPNLRAALKKDNKIDMKKLDDGVYTEVVSLSNAKPIARWMKKDKNWTKITEDEYQAMIRTTDSDNYSRQERRGEQRILDERRTDRGGRGQGRTQEADPVEAEGGEVAEVQEGRTTTSRFR